MITYTYESAATKECPDKKGVNRMTWEGEKMIMKEYFEEDPRTLPSPALAAVLSAKPEEIEAIKKLLGINN